MKSGGVPDDNCRYLVVTPEQLREGYLENAAGIIRQKKYTPLKKLDDGNWVVFAPENKCNNKDVAHLS